MEQEKTALQKMIGNGELISTDYDADADTNTESPLKELSCEKVLDSLPKFVELKLGENPMLLVKIKDHLVLSLKGKCKCWNSFSQMNKEKK